MSQSPEREDEFAYQSDYAEAARQLNKLVRAGRSYSGYERNCCFLNENGNGFVNVSIISGFDFPEDGRAVAICDWDNDGDQDFWVSNRTAPQLRLMRNDLRTGHNSISFQLVGSTSNRDAVGARVQVTVATDSGSSVLQRTVRAGEGFLGCSSRRVHFGLGKATSLESVEVRWPNGDRQTIEIREVNARYRLTEGTATAERVATHQDQSTATDPSAESKTPPQSMATHNKVTDPVPMPPLMYERPDGSKIDLSVGDAKPTLVNLWATWCQPCLLELADWSEHAYDLSSKLRVVAVSVDPLSDANANKQEITRRLTALGYRQQSGFATPGLVDTLQQVHNTVYDHHRPLPVPTSVLLDTDGRLRAIYKGPVSPVRILADVQQLMNTDEPTTNDVPFGGRWLATPGTHKLSRLAEELFREGYQQESQAFVERLVNSRHLASQLKARLFFAEQLAAVDSPAAKRNLDVVLKATPNNPTAHERLALIYARQGDGAKAMHHFQQAIQHATSPNPRTHYNFGRLLRRGNAIERAVEQFQTSIDLNPRFAESHEQLGLIHAANQDFAKAAASFRKALALLPQKLEVQMNLALALDRLNKPQETWDVLKLLVNNPEAPPMAHLIAAKSLEMLKQYSLAADNLEKFAKAHPEDGDIRKKIISLRNRATQ